MRILAKNDRKCISLEPNIVWKQLVPFVGVVSSQKNEENKYSEILPFFVRFRPILAFFLHSFTFLSIFVIFSPYLVISEILQLFVIFCHFLPLLAFFGPFWGICIWMHFKAFKSIFSCSSPLYQFVEVVSSKKNYEICFVEIFFILSPYNVVISEILQLFAIFGHFL